MQVSSVCEECQGRGKRPERTCNLCRGVGVERREEKVAIAVPAGIADGETLKVTSQGEAAAYGGKSGDLYLHIRVKQDPHFERDGNTILSRAFAPFTTMSLGGTIEVETVDGKTTLKIPEGTPPGTSFNLRGKGVPFVRSGGRGDHLVRVDPDVPKKLSREQKHLLEELKKEGL
jgi:molecular chaperone DnaJ